MHDALLIRGIRAEGRHGVLAPERENPQPFEVDLEIEVDLAAAGTSDDLDDTVDYAQVTVDVASIIQQRSFALLERLAGEIANCILARPAVKSVAVTVKKLEPPIPVPLGYVAVRIRRAR